MPGPAASGGVSTPETALSGVAVFPKIHRILGTSRYTMTSVSAPLMFTGSLTVCCGM